MTGQKESIAKKSQACLLMSIEEAFYAISASHVKEVMELPALQKSGGTPSYIAGFVNVRGDITVVLDLRVCLGHAEQPYSLKDHLILVKGETRVFGLLTPEIQDLQQLAVSEAAEVELHSVRPLFHFISSMAKYKEQIVFLIDPYEMEKYILDITPEPFNLKSLEAIEKRSGFATLKAEERKIFIERAKQLTERIQLTYQPTQFSLLAVVELKKEYFAIDIIREFCPISDFTPIPCAPPFIFGFFNLRGHVLPIIDLWSILQGQKNELIESSKILIVEFQDTLIGILVDNVVNLIFSNVADYRTVPLSVKVISDAFIKSTVKYEKEVIPVLDLIKMLKSVQP